MGYLKHKEFKKSCTLKKKKKGYRFKMRNQIDTKIN